jgi:hypothetical protein
MIFFETRFLIPRSLDSQNVQSILFISIKSYLLLKRLLANLAYFPNMYIYYKNIIFSETCGIWISSPKNSHANCSFAFRLRMVPRGFVARHW